MSCQQTHHHRPMNPHPGISPACATTSGDCFAPSAGERENRSFKALSGKGSVPAPPPPFRHTPFRPWPRHTAPVWRNLGQHPHRDGTFTFSAKEKDPETGLSYFGSRYYSGDLSIWLSVDPMAGKYPSLSPYVYCYNNPILIKDPNGQYGVIAIRKQLDENGNVTGGTATLVVNYYYNSSMANSMTQEQAQYVETNIKTNLDQLKGQKITIDGVKYTFDYQISFKDLATIYGSGNPEGWASADKYYKGGPKVGNYLQTVELDGGDVGQGTQYSIGIDFKKLKNYIASGRSDGQTPIHEFFHNLGAVDTFVYGTRIMDYNEQVKGEPVPVRKVQMEDIETLINQSNSKLGIVYEN